MKLLISSSAEKDISKSAKLAQELGVGLEISRVSLYKAKNMTVEETVEKLKKELAGYKSRLTFHAMFSDLNISSADYEIREISQKRYKQSFEIARAIGADTVLFHTGYKGTKHNGSIYEFKEKFVEFWTYFVKEFEKDGMAAVIENVFEDNPLFCIELCDRIKSSNFKLAIDFGHVNLYAPKTTPNEWIKEYGNRLYHTHIHNNFGTNDDHSNLLNGNIEYIKVLEKLKENREISIVLEMFSKEDVKKSIGYIKENNLI